MSGRSEICKCSHDQSTHFKDPLTGERITCLGALCDCKRYVHRDTPDEPVRPAAAHTSNNSDRKPHSDSSCTCKGCTDYKQKHWYGYGGWP